MTLAELYDPYIAGHQYSGFIKALIDYHDINCEWSSNIDLEELDKYVFYNLSQRELYDLMTINDKTAFDYLHAIFIANKYKLDGLYDSTTYSDKYSPIENYDRIEDSTVDVDIDAGARKSKTSYGQTETDSQYGAQKTTNTNGERSVTNSYGGKTVTNNNGERTATNSYGAHNDTDTQENSASPFDDNSFSADTNKSVTHMNRVAYNDSVSTSASTDSVNCSAYTDSVDTDASTDTIDINAHSDTLINKAHDDTINTDSYHDDNKTTTHSRIHGNVGVMRVDQMLEGQRQVVNYVFFDEILKLLCNTILKNCLWLV